MMTSQITKDFQMKSKLRKLADGGSRGEGGGLSKEAVMAAIAAQRGTPAPAPAPAPAPEPVPVQRPGGDYIRNPRSVLAARERAAGLADGGSVPFGSRGLSGLRDLIPQMEAMDFRQQPAQPDPTGLRAVMPRVKAMGYMDGGRVKGPGGRTDDEVGPVMLSDEEYVLPGDTADAIGRDKLDAIRLATHDFKDGRKESKLRKAQGLADGGSPWVADDKGNVRKPNAFGDAAAGPGYQQPRLPPPQPGTAVGPSAVSPGGPRTINMGMVDEVPRSALPPPQPKTAVGPSAISPGGRRTVNIGAVDEVTPRPAQIANNPTAPAAPQAAAGTAPAAATRAEQLGRMAGKATRVGLRIGGGLATTAPLAGFGDYKADTGGVDTSAPGTLGYLAKGEFGNAGTSLSGGLGEALADSGRGFAKTADWAAGLVGAKPDLTGAYDKMITDKLGGYLSLRNPENNSGELMGPPESAKGPVGAAAARPTAAVRSDQGPALPVEPGSYQSRRLSEMGVPLDVQNSKPVVDSATGSTRDFLRTGGTSKYQNLGTYGGNGNIYGKADDPSRPGRINNFVGVGAGAGPENEANGSGSGGYAGRGGVPQSPLRSSSAPSGGSSAPGVDAAVNAINARYDRMLKEGRGRSVEFGSDWSQRHGISLETARGRELNELLGNARTNETSRANAQLEADTSRKNAELNARVQMEQNRANIISQTQETKRKAVEAARKIGEERDADSVKTYQSVADTFAAGDKAKAQRYREILSTLGPELDQLAQSLTPTDKHAFYTNILRQQIGRDEGLVLGRDAGATVQNAVAGGLIGRMSRLGDGAAGKAIDKALGKLPRVGPAISALRPAENLTRFGTIIGAGAGAAMTPEVEEYNRFDPVARDPVSGAALPAREDLREAFTHGAFDTYLNPFNDDVQTVSGRRTDRPKPTEEEAARRYRATLRTE